MGRTITEWIEQLQSGACDSRLMEIYETEDAVHDQRKRYIHALKEYQNTYQNEEVEIFSAPGRTEIGGNHTDHQRGRVLAASVNLDVLVIAAPSDSLEVRVRSEGYRPFSVTLSSLTPDPSEEGTSKALVRGVAAALKEKGYTVGGFRAWMTSDVLGGSGLSSSAAFEVAVAAVFSGLYNGGKISAVEMAVASQIAENRYFGKPSGLMDQMASAVGGLVSIDFEHPDHPLVKRLDVDFASFGYRLCIVDTKGSHADLTPDYAAIPVEMCEVAALFGKKVLREVKEEEIYRNISMIREKAGDRALLRAMHFFLDNRRAKEEAEALQTGDFPAFLQLIRKSGDSSYKYLQNVDAGHDVREKNLCVALAVSEKILGENGAARVHGGGFAGTIQAFVREEDVGTYRSAMEAVFGPGSCYVLRIRPFGGIQVF